MGSKRPPASADRERILGYLLRCSYPRLSDERPRRNRDVPVGSVVAITSGHADVVHMFGILLTPYDGGCFRIRDVASDYTTDWSNAGVVEFLNVSADDDEMQYGARAEFIRKTHAAFKREQNYDYRYGGVKFGEDGDAKVLIRKPFSRQTFPSAPIKVRARTTIKEILAGMRSGGYGTHKWPIDSIHDD